MTIPTRSNPLRATPAERGAPMTEYGKIAILENEVEAQLLGNLLNQKQIPHAVRSYHDAVYDGLFQFQKGWGCVEADLAEKDKILDILQGIRTQGPEYKQPDLPPNRPTAASTVLSVGCGFEFIEKTKHKNNPQPSDQQRGVPQPPFQEPFDRGRTLELPPPDVASPGPVALKDLVDQRASLRDYAYAALSLEELSYLLWCAQGVKTVDSGQVLFRTVPSAGARHAFETYLLANRVEGLGKGLYRYLSVDHQLGEFNLDNHLAAKITKACYDQRFLADSAVVFIWSAVVQRMKWRYGERGYRYLHLDAGHACQNLYLAAESIGCGACAVAAYDDDEMNRLLGLDGKNQFVIYLAAVGKKP